jgi:hypothetical protein
MRTFALIVLVVCGSGVAAAAPTERRLHSDNIDASSFLWNDWNKFVENYHPNYVADDDPVTAWVEGAKGSGAGEWLRIWVTPLDKTTKIRVRVRNGYQKSKDLWKANARAKEVTLRLVPSKLEKQVTLTDTDGWQELAIDQPSGPVRAVELAVRSVYEGTKYADLCISDVQVFATSDTPDNPAFEKSKRDALMAWRASRIAAAKAFSGKKLDLPLYPAYVTTVADAAVPSDDRAALLEAAAKDPGFAKEWKDALAVATAVVKGADALPRAQLAPASAAKLVAVDGLQLLTPEALEYGSLEEDAIRLPLLGTVASLFADQLRVLDVKDKKTVSQFEADRAMCKSELVWVSRKAAKEGTGPAAVQALVIGRCAKVEEREGTYTVHEVEVLVYDATGKLALAVGKGHVEGYRWAVQDGKPMLAGGRSLINHGKVIDAKPRDAVAAK